MSCSYKRCETCNETSCQSCLANYYLKNGQCVTCNQVIENCDQCTGNYDNPMCVSCKNRFCFQMIIHVPTVVKVIVVHKVVLKEVTNVSIVRKERCLIKI